MKWSESYIYTLKESPADAEIPSHILLARGGYIKKLAPGIFTYGPLALRSLRKLEALIREELDQRGCLELLMPMVQPKELWEETGRWTEMAETGLLRFKNRNQQEFCLGATHEEAITDFVRKDIKSYRDLPVILYQVQNKFRDEIRPRYGLMRGREFLMKDAYSFDRTKEEALKSYEKMHVAYTAIFKRLGLNFVVVQADSGAIGGDMSQEFHLLAESGEDRLLVAEGGSYAANVEVCPAPRPEALTSEPELLPREEFHTPGLRTIEDLASSTGIPAYQLVKTMFFSASEGAQVSSASPSIDGETRPVCVLLRGDDEVNPIKLKNILGLTQPPLLLTEAEVFKLTGAQPGSCGPVDLDIPIYADYGVESLRNFIVGANRDDYHLKNVNAGRDFKVTRFADLRMAKGGDLSPDGLSRLKEYRGIEVGHIFYLGTKYSKAMQAQYLNEHGKALPIEMGCYGIGVSRTLQAAVEQSHDKDGIIWPLSIAPFAVHICLLDPDKVEAAQVCETIYKELKGRGWDVLIDDRQERPGVKFKDADLLGMPVRLNIGARGLSQGEIEVINRRSKQVSKVSPEQAVDVICAQLTEINHPMRNL